LATVENIDQPGVYAATSLMFFEHEEE
jgi:hypothetical protein